MPIQTTAAFFTVPSTLSVRLDASWITQYASVFTAKPIAAAAGSVLLRQSCGSLKQ